VEANETSDGQGKSTGERWVRNNSRGGERGGGTQLKMMQILNECDKVNHNRTRRSAKCTE